MDNYNNKNQNNNYSVVNDTYEGTLNGGKNDFNAQNTYSGVLNGGAGQSGYNSGKDYLGKKQGKIGFFLCIMAFVVCSLGFYAGLYGVEPFHISSFGIFVAWVSYVLGVLGMAFSTHGNSLSQKVGRSNGFAKIGKVLSVTFIVLTAVLFIGIFIGSTGVFGF